MSSDAIMKVFNATSDNTGSMSLGNKAESHTFDWNYYPKPPGTYVWPVTIPYTPPPQPKSDAPHLVGMLAALLADGKISEETFKDLFEQIVRSSR